MDCFIPKFKLKYDNIENIKTDRVNTVVFNLHEIKQLKFFGTPDRSKVLSLIRSMDSKKAHGCNDLSIAMLKICDLAIVEPLSLIYEKCLESGKYPSLWKKANVLPIHKKESRQLKKNYRPISMLPICGKLFEKLIFDEIYDHLVKNDLLTPNQSGFRPGDSTINQLLSITYCMCTASEEFPSRETRAVLLDISEAFDKVWHEGLL